MKKHQKMKLHNCFQHW